MNLWPSGSLCNAAMRSHISVHIFGLLQSIAPRPGPCLRRARNVWRTRVEEEAGNARPPSGPILVLVVRLASTCSYIFEEVLVKLRHRACAHAEAMRFNAEA